MGILLYEIPEGVAILCGVHLPNRTIRMNTKILMTTTSLILGLAGLFTLFAPENVLAMLNVPAENSLSLLVQLVGALYFSFALTGPPKTVLLAASTRVPFRSEILVISLLVHFCWQSMNCPIDSVRLF